MADSRQIQAAGAVTWRHGPDGPEVLLIHRPKHDDWSLAKGKQEPGEHLVQTAVREVFEETGLRPVLGRRLRTVGYQVSGSPKWVHYWAAATPAAATAAVLPAGGRPDAPGRHEPDGRDAQAAAGGQGRDDQPGAAGEQAGGSGDGAPGAEVLTDAHAATTPWFRPNSEVDRIDWLAIPRARERLTYARDAWVLDAFARWPRETVPLILLRHATAGNKKGWRGDDLNRPLDSAGSADARALAGVLACFAPRRVVSSPATRCLETVLPYAARIGAAVEAEAAFLPPGRVPDNSSSEIESGDPATIIKRLVAGAEPTVVCVHRENLPVLLAAACEQLGVKPPARPAVPKGGFWALHIGGTELTAIERYTLPTS